jgi:amidase
MEPTWPARRLAAAIAGRQLASRDLLQAFLDRIERVNPALNAVVTPDAERAMEAASAADEAVAQGRARARIEEAHPPVGFSHQVSVFSQLLVAAVSPSLPAEAAEAVGGSHRTRLWADQDRAALRQVRACWFEDFDLLMCPVLGVTAFPHNQRGQITDRVLDVNGGPAPHVALPGWTGLIGVVGLPSAVAPAGRTAAGLPVGVQLVAPFLRDRDAVRAARMVSEVLGGYQPLPSTGRTR